MPAFSDDDLYSRGVATLLACWEAYARGSEGAAVVRRAGVVVGVFPTEPERSFFNNALLDRALAPSERTAALDALESVYRSAGVDAYAAWVHETDEGMLTELRARGYSFSETTRAMGLPLADASIDVPDIDFISPDWDEYLRVMEVPAGLFAGVGRDELHLVMARLAGENVATAMAFDHGGDCGVFNVSTLAPARRRGLGTAITARLVHDARDRGCSTATLQSTPMAEGVYAAVGFRDLGQFIEHVPGPPAVILGGPRGVLPDGGDGASPPARTR